MFSAPHLELKSECTEPHLDKLDEEGRLPDGVERPQLSLLGEP